MRSSLLAASIAFALAPAALAAQGMVNISPQQCVWHARDDLSWAAPNLDEAGWQPYSNWVVNSSSSRIWIRCRADLTSLRAQLQPAIQITLPAAYRLYIEGAYAGGSGNLRSGNFSMNVTRGYPLPASALQGHSTEIALEITYRDIGAFHTPLIMRPPNAEIHAGDARALVGLRAQAVLAASGTPLVNAACFGVIGIVGLMLLGLLYYDRSRLELAYLSINCVCLFILRAREFCVAAQLNLSYAVNLELLAAANLLLPIAELLFNFSLARRRVMPIYWLSVAVPAVSFSLLGMSELLPAPEALALLRTQEAFLSTGLAVIASIVTATSAFVAFWPYQKISARMRPLAYACMLSSAITTIWFAVEMTQTTAWGLPNLFASWRPELLEIRALVTAGVLLALLTLLFRDQQLVTQERALLAGEMQAASEIQQMLAPAEIETAPGLKIEVAFHPMREVGGDFYLCRALADGRQRILIGDVSGKGTAAAMAATLVLGAASARDSDSPSRLLEHLNRVLSDNRLSGFATCLAVDLMPNGDLALANAGHLAPYVDGKELATENGLPLGLSPEAVYDETTFGLARNVQVTLMTDGVVEARSKTGELFGFERTRAMSGRTAEKIAEAAQAFGQEDDITVLTLEFAPAEVVHA